MTNRHKTQSLALLKGGRKMGCRCSLYRETQSREQCVVTSKAIRKGTEKADSIR